MADQIPTYDANGKLVAKPPDWASVYWGSLGLPTDVSARIDKIFAQYADHTTAAALAQQYLRSTTWYAQTFPGIEYGIRNGFFNDETGYRQYVQQVNDAWKTFAGHPISGREVAAWLQQGKSSDYLAKYIEGESIALTNRQQTQALAGAQGPQGQLTPEQLHALGLQQAGISTRPSRCSRAPSSSRPAPRSSSSGWIRIGSVRASRRSSSTPARMPPRPSWPPRSPSTGPRPSG